MPFKCPSIRNPARQKEDTQLMESSPVSTSATLVWAASYPGPRKHHRSSQSHPVFVPCCSQNISRPVCVLRLCEFGSSQ